MDWNKVPTRVLWGAFWRLRREDTASGIRSNPHRVQLVLRHMCEELGKRTNRHWSEYYEMRPVGVPSVNR